MNKENSRNSFMFLNFMNTRTSFNFLNYSELCALVWNSLNSGNFTNSNNSRNLTNSYNSNNCRNSNNSMNSKISENSVNSKISGSSINWRISTNSINYSLIEGILLIPSCSWIFGSPLNYVNYQKDLKFLKICEIYKIPSTQSIF